MRDSKRYRRILCATRSAQTAELLRRALGSKTSAVLTAFTADVAVAFCLNNHVDAVVLSSELLDDTWSVAQTLKSIRPTLPILLVTDAPIGPGTLSEIDVVILSTGLPEIASVLAELLGEKRADNDSVNLP